MQPGGSVPSLPSQTAQPLLGKDQTRQREVARTAGSVERPPSVVVAHSVLSEVRPSSAAAMGTREVKRLKDTSKSLWEWVLSFFPATPLRTITGLMKSFVEHREVDVKTFAKDLLSGSYAGLTTTNPVEIAKLIRENFPKIKALLGPELEKKFLFYLIGEACKATPAHFQLFWQSFIQSNYGENAAREIFKDVVTGIAQDLAEAYDTQGGGDIDPSEYLRALASLFNEAREQHNPLVTATTVKSFIADVRQAGERLIVNGNKLATAVSVFSELADMGFSGGEFVEEMDAKGQKLKRMGLALEFLAHKLSEMQTSLRGGVGSVDAPLSSLQSFVLYAGESLVIDFHKIVTAPNTSPSLSNPQPVVPAKHWGDIAQAVRAGGADIHAVHPESFMEDFSRMSLAGAVTSNRVEAFKRGLLDLLGASSADRKISAFIEANKEALVRDGSSSSSFLRQLLQTGIVTQEDLQHLFPEKYSLDVLIDKAAARIVEKGTKLLLRDVDTRLERMIQKALPVQNRQAFSATALGLLRYQIQDVTNQWLNGVDNQQFSSGMAMMQDRYQELSGDFVQPELRGLDRTYTVSVREGKIVISALDYWKVSDKNDYEKIIGYDARFIELVIDPAKLNERELLASPDCAVIHVKRHGLRQNIKDVTFERS